MYHGWTGLSKGFVSIVLLLVSFGASAGEISINLDDAGISELSLALGSQTTYRVGMSREVQGFSGITLDLVDAKLSDVVRVLEKEYGLCTWVWQPPDGYEGRNLSEIRWAYCTDEHPKGFVNFVRWEE